MKPSRRITRVFLPLILAVSLAVIVAGCKGATPIKRLLDDPSQFDGKTVEIAGKVTSSIGVLGAGAYKLWKEVPVLRGEPGWALATAVGTAAAAVGGYLVIDWLLGWLRTRTTYVFVAWRLAAGIAIALLIARGVLPAGGAPPSPGPAVERAER